MTDKPNFRDIGVVPIPDWDQALRIAVDGNDQVVLCLFEDVSETIELAKTGQHDGERVNPSEIIVLDPQAAARLAHLLGHAVEHATRKCASCSGEPLQSFDKPIYWWLSFVDRQDDGSSAGHLGVAIVKTAGTLEDAATEAWDRRCNPGGEAGITSMQEVRKFPQRLMNRLLTDPDEIDKAKGFIAAARNPN
jgi:hypothetical protein